MTAMAPAERELPQWVKVAAPIAVGVIMLALWVLIVDVLKIAPRALPSGPAPAYGAAVIESRFVGLDLRCGVCGSGLVPVVMPDGEIADVCFDCGRQVV